MSKKLNTSVNKKKVILYFWGLFVVLPIFMFFVIMICAKTGSLGFDDLPSLQELENPKSNLASEIITTDGKLLGKYFKENRTNVKYEDLSPYLISALIATEDERFLNHSGIDFRGLVRAFVKLGKAGGASTITQQLAKMMFHDRKGGFINKVKQKIQEQIIAVELEKRYTKAEILTMYLNKFDFINNAVGIKSACNVYFNKEPKDLNIQEAAMLVGMAKNPALYNPLRRPEITQTRREVVLKQMYKNDYITEIKYDSLRVLPLGLDYKIVDHKEGLAPYYREVLRGELQKMFEQKDEDGKYIYAKKDGTPYNIYSDGLKIYSTIDSRMQTYAEWAVAEYIGKKLQQQFVNQLIKYRIKKFPFDSRISEEQYEQIMQTARLRTARYQILTGQECENCGRRGNFI